MERRSIAVAVLALALSACGGGVEPVDASEALADSGSSAPGADAAALADVGVEALDATLESDAGGGRDAAAGDGGVEPLEDGGAADASADPVLDQRALSVLAGSLHEHEPSIAVSPGGRVALSWLSSAPTSYSVGYRISNDRGATWGPAARVPMPAGTNVQANASVVAAGDDTLYLAWASAKKSLSGVRSNPAVWAARSSKGTTTFEAPVQVTPPGEAVGVYDLPRITVTEGGAVNVAFTVASKDYASMWIDVVSSTDFATWSRVTAVGAGTPYSVRNFARLCHARGRTYLTFWDSDRAQFVWGYGVGLVHSDDGGRTWSQPVTVQHPADELAVSLQWVDCVAKDDDLYVLYGLSSEVYEASRWQTMFSFRLAHSGDHGQTFDDPFDATGLQAARYMYPTLAIEADGALNVAYYAGAAKDDPAAALYRARSTDGRSFSPPALVTSPLSLTTSRTVATWVGDYTGMAYQSGNLYLAYTDNASATPHVSMHRTPAEVPGGGPDAGVGDAGLPTDPGCYADAPFEAVPWAPPTAFGQGACTPAQTAAYDACFDEDDCAAFRAAPANAGCLACLETDVAASAHGPVVTTGAGATLEVVLYNSGGCLAHFDKDESTSGCGSLLNRWWGCISLECGTCTDFPKASIDGQSYPCFYRAFSDGECADHRLPTVCYAEFSGIAAPCADYQGMLDAWCGQ